ncbi:hypothetical protein [Peribacillus frigoritolerans]|uniref:hypothetical protein n=1 Tax=Peribacillus frigoritolerans TaxID=450367 RepID=UPI0022318F34|nr:hypothetical protein [Peribacillus frigoritolerans]UZD45443.1 hypothetical protein OMJ04_17630 [Peribacillus frigoritolerans]
MSKETPQAEAEGGPSAESEYLEWKSNPSPNNISWFGCEHSGWKVVSQSAMSGAGGGGAVYSLVIIEKD